MGERKFNSGRNTSVLVAPLFLTHLDPVIEDLVVKLSPSERKSFMANERILITLEQVGEHLLYNVELLAESGAAPELKVEAIESDLAMMLKFCRVMVAEQKIDAARRHCIFSHDLLPERIWHVALRVTALKCFWLPAFIGERERTSLPPGSASAGATAREGGGGGLPVQPDAPNAKRFDGDIHRAISDLMYAEKLARDLVLLRESIDPQYRSLDQVLHCAVLYCSRRYYISNYIKII